jgi:hypothetical protein
VDVREELSQLDEGDRLFVAHDDTRHATACLNFGFPEHGYVNGFRMAADLAVEYVVATDRDQDYLVFPIVFGYRQYLELRLKGLLKDASRLLDEPPPGSKPMAGHRLSPVWEVLLPLLRRVFDEDDSCYNLLGDRINEFDKLDPSSEAFRYASRKDGSRSLSVDLRHISLTNLRRSMGTIANPLDGWDMGLSHYLDLKAENAAHRAEQANEYGREAVAEYGQYLRDEARGYSESAPWS